FHLKYDKIRFYLRYFSILISIDWLEKFQNWKQNSLPTIFLALQKILRNHKSLQTQNLYLHRINAKYGMAIPNLPIILLHALPFLPVPHRNSPVFRFARFLLFQTDANGSIRAHLFRSYLLPDGNKANKPSVLWEVDFR